MAKHKRKIEKVQFTGIWKPAGLLAMQNINALEKDILADIKYLGEKNGYRVGNKNIARKLGAKHRTVVYALQRLKGLGYTIDTGPNKSHRCLALSGPIPALFVKKPPTKVRANIALAIGQDSDSVRLARLLLSEIRKHIPNFKEPNLQSWAKPIDLMIRLDKRSPERIAEVVRWCQADSGNGSNWAGWQNVILSTKKLRDKFDVLGARMDKGKSYGSNKIGRDFATESDIGETINA